MHRKAHLNQNRNAYLIVGCVAFLGIVIAVLVIFIAGGSNGTTSLQKVVQPMSAAQIAKNLDCINFTDQGAAAILSNDSGVCFIGTKKYAINTFPNKQARDNWLKTATQLGVNPKWETSTAVVYPSTD